MIQLENQYSLFDYGININDVIQLTIMSVTEETNTIKKSTSKVPKNLKDKTSVPSCESDTIETTEEVNFFHNEIFISLIIFSFYSRTI